MAKQIVINLSDEDYQELLKQYEQLKKISFNKKVELSTLNSYLENIIKSIIKTNRKIDLNSILSKKLNELFEKIKDFSNFSDFNEMFDYLNKKEDTKTKSNDEEKYKS